jgi:hypothetical protein
MYEEMNTQKFIIVHGKIEENFLEKIRSWAFECTKKLAPFIYSNISINIWNSLAELNAFYSEERKSLGIVTADETDFLATHEAWNGNPRIHLCKERLMGVPDPVVQGAIQHEIGHAIIHGKPEFYQFRFSRTLQENAIASGMDLLLLKHLVYFLSIAIKDMDVIRFLAKLGLFSAQIALINYLMEDTEKERIAWEIARGHSGIIKVVHSSFLKIVLPIEGMDFDGISEAILLKTRWNDAYRWIPEINRKALIRISINHLKEAETLSFQDRLERLAKMVIEDPHL